MRLIDADELKIDYGFTWDDITPTHDEMYALIDRQPTIEPERKKGKWLPDNNDIYEERFVCSECKNGYRVDITYKGKPLWNFCPNCGCEMCQEGEEHEQSK